MYRLALTSIIIRLKVNNCLHISSGSPPLKKKIIKKSEFIYTNQLILCFVQVLFFLSFSNNILNQFTPYGNVSTQPTGLYSICEFRTKLTFLSLRRRDILDKYFR